MSTEIIGSAAICGNIPPEFLVKKAGYAPRRVTSLSSYPTRLAATSVNNGGNSRRWGDANPIVQQSAILSIQQSAAAFGASRLETAWMLAIARVESGFNPDAAAGTTSAAGLGQLTNAARKDVGLARSLRFSIEGGATGLVGYAERMIVRSKKYFAGRNSAGTPQSRPLPKPVNEHKLLERAYGYYHDGPSSKPRAGLKIAAEQVMPWTKKFSAWLEACNPLSTHR